MDIPELNKQLEKLDLDSAKKEAILSLIDIKTTNDMKEVIKEIKIFKSDMDSKFKVLKSDMDSKFVAMDTKFASLRSDMLTNRWIITFIGVVIVTLATVSQFLD